MVEQPTRKSLVTNSPTHSSRAGGLQRSAMVTSYPLARPSALETEKDRGAGKRYFNGNRCREACRCESCRPDNFGAWRNSRRGGRKKLFSLIPGLILLLSSVAFAEEQEYGCAWGKVVKIYDGDTLTVDVERWPPIIGDNLGVRVFGIDTREMNEGGAVAKEFVKTLIAPGSDVCLSHILRDKYFRIVARVGYDCKPVLDDTKPCESCKDLSRTLLKNKYAVPYDGGTKSEFPEDIK